VYPFGACGYSTLPPHLQNSRNVTAESRHALRMKAREEAGEHLPTASRLRNLFGTANAYRPLD